MQAFERGSLSYEGEITEYTDMADIYEVGGMERKKAERIRDLEDRERELRDNPKRLDDYLDNDELFAAYPELRNIFVDTSRQGEEIFGKMGSYNPWNNTLYLNDTSHSTLAHEVQHAIQRIEGFERGGSPKTVRQKIKDLINENKDASDYAKSRLRLYAEAKVNEFFLEGTYNAIIKSDNPTIRRYAIESYWDAMNFIDNAEDSSLVNEYPDLSPDEIALSGYHVKEAVEELKRLAKSYKEGISEGNMNALNLVQKLVRLLQEKNNKELYAALGGEVESRNVEKRLGMPMDERRASLARETEDVSREDQIFLQDGMGVNISEDDDIRYSIDTTANTITERDDTMYRIREGEAPKKTIKVYKLMRLGNDSKLYPLFIDNANPIEMDQWYDGDAPNFEMLKNLPSGIHILNAQTGEYVMDYDTFFNEHKDMFSGKKKTKNPSVNAINWATENGYRFINIRETERAQKRYDGENRQYYNLGINGSGAVSEFAMRPGWHAGTHPTMRQIGKGTNRDLRDDSFVWVEGEIAADNDYNAEAQRNPDKDLPGKMPIDGYYLKTTNADKKKSQVDRVGWYVSGAFKANRIISDAEARSVIDEWNNANPEKPIDYDYTRESGKEFTEEDARKANEANGVNVNADETVQEVNDRFNKELDDFKNNRHNGLLHLGRPQEILTACGINAESITLSPSVLKKHLKKHGLTTDDLKGLAEAIQKPILCYKHGLRNPNIVVVTELNVRGGKLSVSFELDSNGNVVDVSNISSVHSKEAQIELERLYNMGEEDFSKSLRWVEKEKVLDWLSPDSYENSGTTSNQEQFDIAKVIQNFENPSIEEEKSSSNPLKMKERVEELAEKLNLGNVEIVTNVSQLNGKEKRAKGFFNKRTGKITIVLPNNANIADIEQTLLHEAVVHYGLRQLFGTQFNTFLDNVFNNASEENCAKTAHLGFWFSDLITRNKTMQERGMNLFVEFTI